MTLFEIFGLLIVGHALADYPLQGDFLAKAKNRHNPLPGVPAIHGMLPHAAIHAGFVGVITGNVWLGIAELIAHVAVDDAKCAGRISYHTDQALHVACKVAWVAALYAFGATA